LEQERRTEGYVRVLVTGAAGFVGLNVARQLALAGDEVLAVARTAPDAWATSFLADVTERVNWRRADLTQRGALAAALAHDAFDAVVHAAVLTATTAQVEREQSVEIVQTNVGGTLEALDVAQHHACRRYVYVSSSAALGPLRAGQPADESASPQPETLYGITKLASELLARRYGAVHNLSTASVRIAQPYGPGERPTTSRQRTSPLWEWLDAAERGATLATGPLEVARDWTCVEETARGISELARATTIQHDLYHLSVGKLFTVGEALAQLQHAYPDLRYNVAASPERINPNIADTSPRAPLDVSRFRAEFGWAPEVEIAEGLRRYVTWSLRRRDA
jgi:nucleoside-diphosphate-sugar epimerase